MEKAREWKAEAWHVIFRCLQIMIILLQVISQPIEIESSYLLYRGI